MCYILIYVRLLTPELYFCGALSVANERVKLIVISLVHLEGCGKGGKHRKGPDEVYMSFIGNATAERVCQAVVFVFNIPAVGTS